MMVVVVVVEEVDDVEMVVVEVGLAAELGFQEVLHSFGFELKAFCNVAAFI